MINPAKLLKLKSAWSAFAENHPKFISFLEAVRKNGLKEGTVIEINVMLPDGRNLSSNLKLSESDMKMFENLSELLKN